MRVDLITDRAMNTGAAQKADELRELIRMVSAEQPSTVLEIGTMAGGTLRAWCECAADDAVIVSVDLPDGEWGGGYPESDIPRLRSYRRPGQWLELIRADSHETETWQIVSALFPDGVDFLFIDGDHTEDGVAEDFAMYAPLVHPGGIVAFHDILEHPQVPRCDVDKFWATLEGRTWEFTVEGDERGYGPWGGIGVLEMP